MKNILHTLPALLLALLPGLASRAATDAITLTADTPWLVPPKMPEPLQRALADVQRDWYVAFGHPPIVLTNPPESWTGVMVRFGLSGTPGAPESFTLRVEHDAAGSPALLATGADVRGAIYAAYAFSEEILGVDPWYFWADHPPARRERIDVPGDLAKAFGPPTFRYRGWFINDEDLLSGFAPDPLRENVFSLEMFDRICETILRLRGNMIVPGTFTFPDERCWELASRRGLALNMHHILVVGLNTYRWPEAVPFSYTKHPEIMERYWRDCIAAFKGREVVWTVGYRGKNDQPFWTDEPEFTTPEARGAVITAAIAKQVELVRQADPQATIIANLWSEGAEMMRAGHLKLPAGIVEVWPDDGTGLMLDHGSVQAGQGLYYHTATSSGRHNQLSELVPPSRIYGELGRFVRAGATNFFLVNTSDVRPVPLSTECAMRLVWNATPAAGKSDRENMDAFLAEWSRREFGAPLAAPIAALYARYFDIPYHQPQTRTGDAYAHKLLRALHKAAAPPLVARQPMPPSVLGLARDLIEFARTNRPFVAAVAADASAIAPRVPADRRGFFQAHLLTPLQIHLQSLILVENYAQALLARDQGQPALALAAAQTALQASDDLIAAPHAAETGKWAGWYIGDGFVGLENNRDRVRALLAALRGEPRPPARSQHVYRDIYQYQEPFRQNFPLFYPHREQP